MSVVRSSNQKRQLYVLTCIDTVSSPRAVRGHDTPLPLFRINESVVELLEGMKVHKTRCLLRSFPGPTRVMHVVSSTFPYFLYQSKVFITLEICSAKSHNQHNGTPKVGRSFYYADRTEYSKSSIYPAAGCIGTHRKISFCHRHLILSRS